MVALVERELGLDPSYFEVVTGAALRWFADVAVDVAVVEVGLGGTWDATNVIDADIAVVTNVSIDHTQYLGTTAEQIATEKAGIVKEGSDARARRDRSRSRPVLHRSRCRRGCCGATSTSACAPTFRRSAAACSSCSRPARRYPDVFVPLHGAHQGDNAAIALAAAEAFVGAPLEARRGATTRSRACARRAGSRSSAGIRSCCSTARTTSPAREALRDALAEEFAPAPRTLVIGLLREKEPREMLTALGLDDVAQLVCARPPNPRALDPAVIAEAAVELGFPAEHIEVVDTVGRGGVERAAHDARGRRDRDHRLALLRRRGARHACS